MRVGDLSALAGVVETVTPGDPDAGVTGAYTSDLLSDVLAHARPGDVLVTIQAHRTTVAVAAIAGIRAILLAHARAAPPDMVEAAVAERVAILRAAASQYELSWRLHGVLP
jgi:hypothetical protein